MIAFSDMDGTAAWNNDKYAEIFEYDFVWILYNG